MTDQSSRQPGDDPFDGVIFDDDFVRGAKKREPAAADRLARSASLRSHLVDEQQLRKKKSRIHRRVNRQLSRRARSIGRWIGSHRGLLLVVLVVAVFMWWNNQQGQSVAWQGAGVAFNSAAPTKRPTPAPAVSDTPLGTPDEPPATGGAYRFVATQPNSSAPVTYDPCRPIAVVINERTMPKAATGVINEAIDELSAITGFHFSLEGLTDEPPSSPREPFQPERYGDRWAPVLIAWTDDVEAPELAGSVAGVGGSQLVSVSAQEHAFTTGIVYLDGTDASHILGQSDGRALVKAIVLHELGHLIGLDHVDDQNELMHETNTGQVSYGNGDLTGIAALAKGSCVPEL